MNSRIQSSSDITYLRSELLNAAAFCSMKVRPGSQSHLPDMPTAIKICSQGGIKTWQKGCGPSRTISNSTSENEE